MPAAGGPPDRPRWDRLLDPFRSEQAAFRVVVVVAGVCAAVVLLVLLLRAL